MSSRLQATAPQVNTSSSTRRVVMTSPRSHFVAMEPSPSRLMMMQPTTTTHTTKTTVTSGEAMPTILGGGLLTHQPPLLNIAHPPTADFQSPMLFPPPAATQYTKTTTTTTNTGGGMQTGGLYTGGMHTGGMYTGGIAVPVTQVRRGSAEVERIVSGGGGYYPATGIVHKSATPVQNFHTRTAFDESNIVTTETTKPDAHTTVLREVDAAGVQRVTTEQTLRVGGGVQTRKDVQIIAPGLMTAHGQPGTITRKTYTGAGGVQLQQDHLVQAGVLLPVSPQGLFTADKYGTLSYQAQPVVAMGALSAEQPQTAADAGHVASARGVDDRGNRAEGADETTAQGREEETAA